MKVQILRVEGEYEWHVLPNSPKPIETLTPIRSGTASTYDMAARIGRGRAGALMANSKFPSGTSVLEAVFTLEHVPFPK